MKKFSYAVLAACLLLCGFVSKFPSDNIELSCVKNHKASNSCHFNFKVDGAKYRFVDMGCKYGRNKEEVLKMAKEGNLALAKDWKIECPAPKSETPSGNGF
jgi:hypothetical protein